MAWSRAVKTQLGDTYHLLAGGVARCNPKIRLVAVGQYDERPKDVYCCRRCVVLEGMDAVKAMKQRPER